MRWGVVPGRQVGNVTKRFHKRREGTDAERAVAKALGITLADARRQLRYAQQYQGGRTAASKEQDWLALAQLRREREALAQAKAEQAEADRVARVAAYNERSTES
jgi:hypothetical protein